MLRRSRPKSKVMVHSVVFMLVDSDRPREVELRKRGATLYSCMVTPGVVNQIAINATSGSISVRIKPRPRKKT